MNGNRSTLGVVLTGSIMLAACGSSEVTKDLRAYVTEVKARPAQRIPPLPEIKQVETFVYLPNDRRDPFKPSTEAGQDTQEQVGTGISPDPYRRKEELEAFPLDSLRMVGTIEKDNMLWGLVENREGMLYRVKPGSYLGQNHGQIASIKDTEIMVNEIIPNGLGGYRERQATLALAEK